MNIHFPLVTILTPVYNAQDFVAECIESVLKQKYKNWEYIIVNNCSTDLTLDIAQCFADLDSRIRIVNNDHFVNAIENHNIAFNLLSLESKYCKVVSADDWIMPDCVGKLVELAEANPTVGIVGSYQRSNSEIRWAGLPRDIQVIPGREVCRLTLLENLDVFGNPTSILYRSELVRKNKPFFPHSFPHADTSACFKYLQYCDFGFVHEILSMGRIHDQQISSKVRRLNISDASSLHNLLEYGPIYLAGREFETRKKEMIEGYYRGLGGCILKMKEREFWKFHSSRLKELGYPIRWLKVIKGSANEIIDEMQNPRIAFHKLFAVLKEKCREMLKRRL